MNLCKQVMRCAALAAVGLPLALTLHHTASAAVDGTVFQDFNANGVRNTTGCASASTGADVAATSCATNAATNNVYLAAVDKPLAGVTVTVRCVTNRGADGILGTSDDTYQSASQVTTATGAYSVNVPGAITPTAAETADGKRACRVQFTWDAATADYSNTTYDMRPTQFASGSPTSVQFVNDGATGVDFGLNRPGEYCENNPFLATTCFLWPYTGAGTAGSPFVPNANGKAVLRIPSQYTADVDGHVTGTWTAAPSRPAALAPTRLAGARTSDGTGSPTAGDTANRGVGTTYGLAYNERDGRLFVGSYVRRKTAQGNFDNLNGDDLGSIYVIPDAAAATPGVAQKFTDLNAVFGSPVAGTNPHPLNTTVWENDTATRALVGKTGLGDLELSADRSRLYVVNLNDRQLYSIPTAGPITSATVSRWQIPIDANLYATTGTRFCAPSDIRPFGLGLDRFGRLHVGVVCSAQSTGNAQDVFAYVLRFDPTAGTFTEVFRNSMNYQRNAGGSTRFVPWTDTNDSAFSVPSALLTDIDFDGQDMILGFRDRFADQTPRDGTTAAGSPVPGSSATNLFQRSFGETVLACYDSATGRWNLENNGGCGGRTSLGTPSTGPSGPQTSQGPGGRSFFEGDLAADDQYFEASQGALAKIPGFDFVWSTAFDAVNFNNNTTQIQNNYNTGGIQRYGTTNGQHLGAYDVFLGADQNTFAKANGLGDLEAMCSAAPIEVGNRIWFDGNGNGLQDPGERPIAGVTVRLMGPDGSGPDGIPGNADDAAGPGGVVASATTDSQGRYFFSSRDKDPSGNAMVDTPSAKYNLPIRYDQLGYKIVLDDSANYATGAPLAGYVLTTANAGSDAELNSKAVLPGAGAASASNPPTVTFNTSGPLANVHAYDIGFTLQRYALGNRVWYDTNNNGRLDAGEQPIVGVQLELLDSAGNPTGATTTTNADGYYLFDNLDAGTYAVRVAASNWSGGTGVLRGYASSSTDTSTFAAADNGTDHGLSPASASAYVTDGVRSANITLGEAALTGEDSGALVPNSAVGDANDNRTVDFGFYRLTVGNQVFRDNNNNGTKDGASDPGIDGVTVQLLKGGVLVATTTTSGGGLYSFTQGTDASGNGNGQPLLPGADYTIVLPGVGIPGGLVSSGDITTTPNPTAAGNGTDSDDNGVGTGSTNISSNAFTLEAAPTLPAGANVSDAARGVTDNPTLDFGLAPIPGVTVGNFVWFDTNRDGIQSAGEAGVPNVTATLSLAGGGTVRYADGTAVPAAQLTQLTDANGGYSFTGLAAGTYVVNFSTLPAGYTPTTTSAPGSTTDNDSNGLSATSRALLAGESDLSLDLGLVALPGVNIGNYVWTDLDGDGIQEAGEPPVPGVSVTISKVGGGTVRDVTGNPVTTLTKVTDANGLYDFSGLEPGQYTVTFSNLPGGYSVTTTNAPGSTPENDSGGLTQSSANLSSGQSDLTLDLGLVPRFALGNRVWLDGNNNGVVDASEVGIDGITVRLLTATGSLVTTTTTANGGFYLFPNLLAGSYIVEVVPPDGYVSSTGTNGSRTGPFEPGSTDFAITGDSRDHGTAQPSGTVRSAAVTLGLNLQPSGEAVAPGNTDTTPDAFTNLTVDFGLFLPAKLGNLVWIDNGAGGGTANNGRQDGTEPGLNGVTIRVLDASNTLIATTTTSNNPVGGAPGWYEVTNLVPGQYRTEFVLPPGYTFSTTGTPAVTTGSPPETSNNQASSANPRTALVTLGAGDNNPQLDAGVVATASDPAQGIPTLNAWMLMLLALLTFGFAARGIHRR